MLVALVLIALVLEVLVLEAAFKVAPVFKQCSNSTGASSTTAGSTGANSTSARRTGACSTNTGSTGTRRNVLLAVVCVCVSVCVKTHYF